jgi:UDP-N-acetylglucosamine 2-epimerase
VTGEHRVVKVTTVIGARPQFIKAAVVSRALRNNPKVQEVLAHTGQYYDEICLTYSSRSSIYRDLIGISA